MVNLPTSGRMTFLEEVVSDDEDGNMEMSDRENTQEANDAMQRREH